MQRKNISILGSTGSVGTQTLDVIRSFKNKFRVLGLSAGKNLELLEKQTREFRPKKVSVLENQDKKYLEKKFPEIKFTIDPKEISTQKENDLIVSAFSGRSNIDATLETLKIGKNVALAQKEVLVEKGEEVKKICKKTGAKIIPVDSEHSAIFQSIGERNSKEIEKIILTCSGGPFFGKDRKFLKNVKPKDALAHPKWNMGKKISIDSATLMNKALEIIEAVRLFDINADQIQVVIHREALIHSGVQFIDGNLNFTAGIPDMRIPISFALNYPERIQNNLPRIDFSVSQNLNFSPPDEETFPSLKFARIALEKGEEYCRKLNITNDKAVELFIKEEISFLEIFEILEKSLKN